MRAFFEKSAATSNEAISKLQSSLGESIRASDRTLTRATSVGEGERVEQERSRGDKGRRASNFAAQTNPRRA